MRAMVLAAGRGERLRPYTDRVPKPMIQVDGKPLIHYTLSYLRSSGFREVVVNLHHLGHVIRDYLGDGSAWGLRILYSFERVLLGTGGGIQKAAPFLVQGPFVVMNADILVELDLREVLQFHRERQAAVTMVLREDPEVERFGAIEIDSRGRVREFLGKLGAPGVRRRRLMFTGLHVLEPAVFAYMPSEVPAFSITDVYVAMLKAGERIFGYEMKGFWTDLGTPERLRRLERMVATQEVPLPRLRG
ncbi:MAG: nucleotidyltransferase family protein [bacterium]